MHYHPSYARSWDHQATQLKSQCQAESQKQTELHSGCGHYEQSWVVIRAPAWLPSGVPIFFKAGLSYLIDPTTSDQDIDIPTAQTVISLK